MHKSMPKEDFLLWNHLPRRLAYTSFCTSIFNFDILWQTPGKPTTPTVPANLNGDIYIADGDYIKDIEVNDLRNRYTLTKGSTQKMVITSTTTGISFLC